MQIAPAAHITPASATAATERGEVIASQTIDMRATTNPAGGVSMWSTDREYRLAGARTGVDTFTSLADAVSAAHALSAGSSPGLAVMTWRGGFRLHDVHASSRTFWSNSPHGPLPPITRELKRSSVPFSAGNLRFEAPSSGLAVARNEHLVALIDGSQGFRVDRTQTWAGRPLLVRGGI